jgi:hypothetical protein
MFDSDRLPEKAQPHLDIAVQMLRFPIIALEVISS